MRKILQIILPVGIILLAAFLRLYKIDGYMTFLGDEGRDVLVVYNILHGHFTLLGPTSSVGGFFLGPIYYYFMAPFLWVFHYNPVGPAVMVALFGIVTVWLVYKVGSEFFNKTVGSIASILYAISPVVIAYSRSSWNPNLVPFFTLFAMYVLYLGVTFTFPPKKKNISSLFFILSGLFLGIILQLHYLGVFIGAILGMYVLLTRIFFVKESIKEKVFGVCKQYMLIFLGFIIGFSPYLAFEARHGFPNTLSIFRFILHSPEVGSSGNSWVVVQDVFFRLFGRLVTEYPPSEQISFQGHINIAAWYTFTLLLGLLSFGYFVWQISLKFSDKSLESRRKELLQSGLLLVWFTLGIFLFGFYKKAIYDYYFAFLFPLPFLFVANFLDFLWKKSLAGKVMFLAIFIFLVWINLQAAPFRFTPNNQLAQARNIAQFVLDKTGNKPYNFALITGGNSDHAYRYFFTIWGHPPVTILNPGVDPKRNSVTNQLFVVCETLPCAPLGYSLWEIAGFGRAEIASKWNVSVVQVYKLVHYPTSNVSSNSTLQIDTSNWKTFTNSDYHFNFKYPPIFSISEKRQEGFNGNYQNNTIEYQYSFSTGKQIYNGSVYQNDFSGFSVLVVPANGKTITQEYSGVVGQNTGVGHVSLNSQKANADESVNVDSFGETYRIYRVANTIFYMSPLQNVLTVDDIGTIQTYLSQVLDSLSFFR